MNSSLVEVPDPKDIFRGTAEYYRKYRRPYLPQVFADIVEYFALDGKGALLDLGAARASLPFHSLLILKVQQVLIQVVTCLRKRTSGRRK